MRAAFEVDQAVRYMNDRVGPGAVRYFCHPFGHVPDYMVHDYFPRHGQGLGLRAAFGIAAAPVTNESEVWNLPQYVCGWIWKSTGELERLLAGLA